MAKCRLRANTFKFKETRSFKRILKFDNLFTVIQRISFKAKIDENYFHKVKARTNSKI